MINVKCSFGPIILTSACLLGSACTATPLEDEAFVVTVESEPVVGPSWNSYRAIAIENDDGSFVAEGDLYFPNEDAMRTHYENLRLEEPSPKLAAFQQISTGFEPIFQGGDALSIVYCVSDTLPNQAAVIQDMATATNDWKNNTNVRFLYDATQNASCSSATTAVDFAVVPTTSPGLAGCALSKLFWSELSTQCASGLGTLEVQYSQLPLFPGMTGAGLLRHELGHMLGFRHEHPWAPSGGGCGEVATYATLDTTGRRLTTYDQLSVMHYAQCSGIAGVDSTISALDQQGAISVYGIPAAWHVALL